MDLSARAKPEVTEHGQYGLIEVEAMPTIVTHSCCCFVRHKERIQQHSTGQGQPDYHAILPQ